MKPIQVYELRNYRQGFAKLFLREKELKSGTFTIAGLARDLRIQPSYLTNVTKERAHFSSDQIHALAEKLGLQPDEADFLNLLMEEERTSHEGRKKRLQLEIERRRRQHLRAEKVLAAKEGPLEGEARERYYLDPHVELIHLFAGTSNAPTKASEIGRRWGLAEAYVAEILAFLQKENLLRLKNGRWEREKIFQHLPRESPLSRPGQLLKRMKAIDTLQKLPENSAYAFSATVTTSEEARIEIQAAFLEFLKTCERAVKKSEPENVYQIQFDLFPWILPRKL